MDDDEPVPWNAVAALYPEFVQWLVQTYGPLPEFVDMNTYEHYRDAYVNYLGGLHGQGR